MLTLRPNSECRDRDLPPESGEAMICSYECSFCRRCVDTVLANVCPNCGGGFQPRPIRPRTARRAGVSLAHQPASTKRVHLRHSIADVRAFAAQVKEILPQDR